jgi:tetratricopeptide (TPR) repeat protein
VYATIGLNREAEREYLIALDLIPPNDLDERAFTQKKLGHVYESLGLFDRAIARFAQARKAYQRLRNRAMVNALLSDQHRLKKPRGRR